MKTLLLSCALLAALAASSFAESKTPPKPEPIPLDAMAATPGIAETTLADFGKAWPTAGFQWLSEAKDGVQTTRPGLTLSGLPVIEVTARIHEGKVSGLVLLFYARGDAGNMPREKFEALLADVVKAVSTLTAAKPVDLGKNAQSAVKAEETAWNTPSASYRLESSFTREVKSRDVPFRAEFIRLTIGPPSKESSLLTRDASSLGRQAIVGTLAAGTRVTRRENGDAALTGVPMVDQGPKGYCVVASVERVMRYFDVGTDQHEMAQIANASAAEGTSSEAMMGALKKLAGRLRVRVRTQYDMEVRDFLDLVRDYNRAAKRAKEDEVRIGNGRVIDVAAIYAQMKGDVLRTARTSKASDYGKFQREVKEQIEAGKPLLWSVALGLIPEPDIPQAAGGHMRLIIGYNTKTSEILYSDSWGRGHEEKRMPIADAWTITKGLYTIEPI